MFPELYFKAAIEAMDTEIGRLMQWLTVHNISDSTNIIFIGDNGNDINVAQVPNPAHSKGTLYEYGVHVPFIISGPAVSTPGVSSALVSTPDLFATMLDMCGFTNWFPFIPAARLPVDAVSLSPILQNQTTTLRNYIFTEQFQTTANPNDGKTIRNTDFKLIRFDNGSEEFYNISSDTVEQNNLLTTTLNTIQTANYNYLCSQLDSLLSTNYCVLTIPSVPVDNKISVCPTFFTDKQS
jgi:arylsulfatase A-like enzyme